MPLFHVNLGLLSIQFFEVDISEANYAADGYIDSFSRSMQFTFLQCLLYNRIGPLFKRKVNNIGYDKDENPVFLADSPFLLTQAQGDYPAITFHTTSDFKLSSTEF